MELTCADADANADADADVDAYAYAYAYAYADVSTHLQSPLLGVLLVLSTV